MRGAVSESWPHFLFRGVTVLSGLLGRGNRVRLFSDELSCRCSRVAYPRRTQR